MTRVRDLDFSVPAALYRGDGHGVAEILRTPFEHGGSWARVVEPGAGIASGHLYLARHVDDHVFAVDGDEQAAAPADGRTDLDARLRPLGSYFEVQSVAEAQLADAEGGAAHRAAEARMAAQTFTVAGRLDGGRWSVTVHPTAFGATTLECHPEAGGPPRMLQTTVDRAELERARTQQVEVEATYTERRALVGGMRTRNVVVTLSPGER